MAIDVLNPYAMAVAQFVDVVDNSDPEALVLLETMIRTRKDESKTR